MIGARKIDYLARGVLEAMRDCKRKITEEQAQNIIERNDWSGIFSMEEVCGYGVYCQELHKDEKTGEYYVTFSMGSSCD